MDTFYISATSAMVQMVMASDTVAENVAGGGPVQVCASITGVTELECSVVATASIVGSTKAGKWLQKSLHGCCHS